MKKILAACLMALTATAMTAAIPAEKTDTTFTATSNPFVKYKYLGDPAALVDGDKVYIYAGHDECPDNQNRYVMHEWCIFSTSDMKTFTEHAYTLKATEFPWARGEAWASQVIERNGKYYWYVTAEHKSIRGKAIGVAVADSPIGPFVPQPEALVTNDMTTKYTPIGWEDIDPTVWIDDDGQAYMFWGNTQLYYVKLKDNMVELDGEMKLMEGLEDFHEAAWVHKYKGKYYLSYSDNHDENWNDGVKGDNRMRYAISDNPLGPWKHMGIYMEPTDSYTNHGSIVEYKGQWFAFYHNSALSHHDWLRSICVDKLYYNEDGSIQMVKQRK